MDKQTIINILSKHDTEVDNFNSALCSVDYETAAEEILELVKANSVLGGVVNCDDVDHNIYINYDGECGACGSSIKK